MLVIISLHLGAWAAQDKHTSLHRDHGLLTAITVLFIRISSFKSWVYTWVYIKLGRHCVH